MVERHSGAKLITNWTSGSRHKERREREREREREMFSRDI
jgi:hypothetical protein